VGLVLSSCSVLVVVVVVHLSDLPSLSSLLLSDACTSPSSVRGLIDALGGVGAWAMPRLRLPLPSRSIEGRADRDDDTHFAFSMKRPSDGNDNGVGFLMWRREGVESEADIALSSGLRCIGLACVRWTGDAARLAERVRSGGA
jgi:hypothetical protein